MYSSFLQKSSVWSLNESIIFLPSEKKEKGLRRPCRPLSQKNQRVQTHGRAAQSLVAGVCQQASIRLTFVFHSNLLIKYPNSGR